MTTAAEVLAHGGGSVGHVAAEYLPLTIPIVLITAFLFVLWRRSSGS